MHHESNNIYSIMTHQIERYIKVVERFNNDLEKYYSESGERELPDIETTIIGFSELEPAEIHRTKNGFVAEFDGWSYPVTIETDDDGEQYIDGWENGYMALKDAIAFNRRRLRKAWRIWKSDNPDAELENDNDE